LISAGCESKTLQRLLKVLLRLPLWTEWTYVDCEVVRCDTRGDVNCRGDTATTARLDCVERDVMTTEDFARRSVQTSQIASLKLAPDIRTHIKWQSTFNKLTFSTLCSEKNTHSHFLSYLHGWWCI